MPEAFTTIAMSPHILFPFWIMVGLTLLAIASTVTLRSIERRDAARNYSHDSEGWWFGVWLSGSCAVLAGIVLLVSLIPYDAKYHHLYAVEGTVASVSNVLQEGSGELTYAPVVELEGEDFVLAVSDSRAASLQGERVTFTCSIEFVHLGADRYNCHVAEVHR